MESQLLDSAQRALRAPKGRSALALHLSRLAPPAPRPHHRRVAHALLAEAAFLQGGHVYPLRNGDMVLLCRGELAPLAATCARLFHVDAPDPDRLLTAWALEEDGDGLVRYAASRVADAPAPPPPDVPAGPRAVDAVAALIGETALGDLVQRQSAVLLSPGGAVPIRPLFREITLSAAAVEARLAVAGQAQADPFLLRHLAGRLDARVLAALLRAGGLDGPLAVRNGQGQALHLNLTLPGVSSAAFVELAAGCSIPLGVEIALLDAVADPGGFRRVRDALRAAGVAVVLDDVSHHALAMTRPAVLDADLVKLCWHPALPHAGLGAALERLRPERVVLQRADTEAAVAWGLAHGISRFQGQHVDNMLAAQRVRVCGEERTCTMRQCAERGSAAGPAGRAGCSNPALLDVGVA